MHLSVYVFGLEDFESRELGESLESLDSVEEVSITLSEKNVRPQEIYASTAFAHYSIQLVELVLAGALAEGGKGLYVLSKERIRRRLKRWAEARNHESKRERIRFTLSESGEMIILLGRADQDREAGET